MNYNKYNMGSFNLHTIKTDKFKTITVKVNFKRPLIKEEIASRNLVCDILFRSSTKYPNQRSLIIKKEELYNLKLSSGVSINGLYSIMSFNIHFLSPKYTEENIENEAIAFLLDLVLNPDIENDGFKTNKLKLVTKTLLDEIDSIKDNPKRYALLRLFEEMDKKAPFSYSKYGSVSAIEALTEKDLYEYYRSIIHSDLIDIFVIGDIDVSKVKNIFADELKINTLKKKGSSHFYEHKKIRKIPKVVKEKFEAKQSNLLLGIKMTNLSDFEKKYVLPIYNFILGGGPDSKLFKNVREKNSLCYNVGSSLNVLSNIIYISAGIDVKNYRKTVGLIKKELANINKGLVDDNDINKAQKMYHSVFEEIYDSPSNILDVYVSKEYLGFDDIEVRKKEINKVTKEMVINLSKKLHLDTIYFLEGGSHAEEGI